MAKGKMSTSGPISAVKDALMAATSTGKVAGSHAKSTASAATSSSAAPKSSSKAKNLPTIDTSSGVAPTPRGPPTPADEGLFDFKTVSGQPWLEWFEKGAVGEGGVDGKVLVHLLQLEDDGGPSKEKAYVRLPAPTNPPYILRLQLDAGSKASKDGVLRTNFSLDGGKFDRHKISGRRLPDDVSRPITIDLPILQAGAFTFWLEYTSTETGERVQSRPGYFNVDPLLTLPRRAPILGDAPLALSKKGAPGGQVQQGKKEVQLSLDGLVVLSLIAKWLGTVDEWEPYLTEASRRGYNMLHWTPLQQRGESGSPYSIYDQLAFDDALFSSSLSTHEKADKLASVLSTIRSKHGMLNLTDVVWNHTANNSPWLNDHPESGYNPGLNAPHLAPALELDTALMDFSGRLAALGLPTELRSAEDLARVMQAVEDEVLAKLRLWEFYVLDVEAEKARVKAAWPAADGAAAEEEWPEDARGGSAADVARALKEADGALVGFLDLHDRFAAIADPKRAVALVKAAWPGVSSADEAAAKWGEVVDALNVDGYALWDDDKKAILSNLEGRARYTRLDEHGPKLGEISEKNPLNETYFTRLKPKAGGSSDPRSLALANNGWIWNANPLQDFASPPSRAYLRREVIVWGDCVKLRYGRGPEDNPWLWEHMTTYTQLLARMFDGFRIDNCHSTPLHVGEYLLDKARVANPNIYVCAELFTGSEEMDLHFVSRLGVNSLIRELFNGHDPKEQSRLLYRFGVGKPVGSMDDACLSETSTLVSPTGKGPDRPCLIVPHAGSAPHALLFDQTHDNESPLSKRTAEDALASGALASFSFSAIGSNKGFDDLYPKLLNLVSETRKYERYEDESNGIGAVKRVLNHLHAEMVLNGYSEGHVHQEIQYTHIHRVHPQTHRGYFLVAHTAFFPRGKSRGDISPIQLRGTKARFILGASIDISSYDDPSDTSTIKGLPHKLVDVLAPPVQESADSDGRFTEIRVPDEFPPGSIMVFETWMEDIDESLDALCKKGADDAVKDLGLVELNVVLHRTDGEEKDATDGEIGGYDVPGYGQLAYCGLEGWIQPLRHVISYNDLGHALSAHLREGTWALDYIQQRLERQLDTFPAVAKQAEWFKERFDIIKRKVPSSMRPKYFAIVVNEGYKASVRRVFALMSDLVKEGPTFTKELALVAVQMHGQVQSASLDPGKPTPSLAAGLPHFSAGWARVWGRDVSISMRGLFLVTGAHEAARQHILAFCSTLKHGLIPNLIDSIRTPRYNSRDSPWWLLQNIQDYTLLVPNGERILNDSVKRRFPLDDTWVPWDDARAYSHSSTVAEVVQEILQRHASGIHFREYNAGPNLDQDMRDEGFNIDVDVDWKTGFVKGGNRFNCGTWMDKMGSSAKAGNKGFPATPRDGAPVEITGLVYSSLRWFEGLAKRSKIPWKGVKATIEGKEVLVTYGEWAQKIKDNFERHYYIPTNPADDSKYVLDPSLVNKRGIYKDVYGTPADRAWSDYQLRAQYPIAATVAPDLFNPQHALGALKVAEKYLLPELGMRTLDPEDMQYRPYYDNSNDSDDISIAKGWNYHNGPAWGWPVGYLLRAYLKFSRLAGENIDATIHHLSQIVAPYKPGLERENFRGLAELWQGDGSFCYDSCRSQAWSASTMLDFLDDVRAITAE